MSLDTSPLLALDHPSATERALAGGKAGTLAQLLQMDFRVPKGFIIPANASWDETLDRHIQQAARFLLSLEASPFNLSTFKIPARPARPALAVRSSVCCEDGAEASFAGQFQTCLNNHDILSTRHAAHICQASFNVARIEHYTDSLHLPTANMKPGTSQLPGAVLIQQQVPAQWAGVCFTADPESGIEQLSVIEAIPGLGDELVSGQRTPTYIRIDRRSGRILKFQTEDPQKQSDKFTQTHEPLIQLAHSVCAMAEQVRAALGGEPLDIEWAYDGSHLWILQARPITTPYFSIPERKPITEPEVWFHGNFAETMPGPIPVLSSDVVREFAPYWGLPGATHDLIKEMNAEPIEFIAGRVCWNFSFFMGAGLLTRYSYRIWELIDHRMIQAIETMQKTGHLSRLHFSHGALTGKRFIGLILFNLYFGWSALRALGKAKAAITGLKKSAQDLLALTGSEPVETLSADEAWRRARILMTEFGASLNEHVPVFCALFVPVAWGSLASRWSSQSFTEALGTMDNDPSGTVLMQRALHSLGLKLQGWNIARDAKPSDLPAEGMAALNQFLEDFGHRGPGEQDISNPRLLETPELALELALLSTHNKTDKPIQKHGDSDPRIATFRETLYAQIESKGITGRLKVRFLKWLLPHAQRIAPIREDGKHLFWMPVNQRMRALILRAGSELNSKGILACPDDVFHFKAHELDQLILGRAQSWGRHSEIGHLNSSTARALVTKRKQQLERWRRLEFQDVLRSDGRPVRFKESQSNQGTQWKGVAISTGHYEGIALVARTFEEARKLKEGEILIAPSVDPGWTPLFARAGALVMEVGGVLSHGAVVAREVQLPAVAGIHRATTIFKTGQRLIVDGRMGTISLAVDA